MFGPYISNVFQRVASADPNAIDPTLEDKNKAGGLIRTHLATVAAALRSEVSTGLGSARDDRTADLQSTLKASLVAFDDWNASLPLR
jgi:SLT domain-containing protein